MNGQKLNESILFPKEIESKVKKKLIYKFSTALILSNLLVLLLSAPSSQISDEKKIVLAESSLRLKLELLVPLNLENTTEVSLYDQRNHLLAKKAYIIKRMAQKDTLLDEREELFEVSVFDRDLKRILSTKNIKIKATPPNYIPKKLTVNTFKRGPYEITF